MSEATDIVLVQGMRNGAAPWSKLINALTCKGGDKLRAAGAIGAGHGCDSFPRPRDKERQ